MQRYGHCSALEDARELAVLLHAADACEQVALDGVIRVVHLLGSASNVANHSAPLGRALERHVARGEESDGQAVRQRGAHSALRRDGRRCPHGLRGKVAAAGGGVLIEMPRVGVVAVADVGEGVLERGCVEKIGRRPVRIGNGDGAQVPEGRDGGGEVAAGSGDLVGGRAGGLAEGRTLLLENVHGILAGGSVVNKASGVAESVVEGDEVGKEAGDASATRETVGYKTTNRKSGNA